MFHKMEKSKDQRRTARLLFLLFLCGVVNLVLFFVVKSNLFFLNLTVVSFGLFWFFKRRYDRKYKKVDHPLYF